MRETWNQGQIQIKKEEFIIEQQSYPPIKHTLDKKGISYIQVPVEQNGIQIDPILHTNNNILYITPSHQFLTGYVTMIKYAPGEQSNMH